MNAPCVQPACLNPFVSPLQQLISIGAVMGAAERGLWGGREVNKRKGEEYQLMWKDHPDFVRMAAKLNALVIPFAAVGGTPRELVRWLQAASSWPVLLMWSGSCGQYCSSGPGFLYACSFAVVQDPTSEFSILQPLEWF